MLRYITFVFLYCLVWQTECAAQEKNIFSFNRPQTDILSTSPSKKLLKESLTDSINVGKDPDCSCKASLPLEIVSTSIIWGVPSYWLWRNTFDGKDSSYGNPRAIFVAPALFLLMATLGPIAEWTSGCEASYWHTLWIGFGTSFTSVMLYGAAYGFKHGLNPYKFNLPEYLAIGVVPAVASSFIFNLFLHPKELHDQSFMIFPSIGRENQACLNLVGRF